MEQAPVVYEEVNDVAFIRFNRPEKLNALNAEAWKLLGEYFRRVCRTGIKAIVLTGRGRAFSSGDDIYSMHALDTPTSSVSFFKTLYTALEAMATCRRPIVAAVNGLAVGGGAEILLLADVVIASRNAWFAFPESHIGLIPPLLSTIGRSVFGQRKARMLGITGARLDVEEAKALGLIDDIVDPEDLESRALAVAESLGSIPDQSVIEIRRATLEHYRVELEKMVEKLAELVLTREAKERMAAFIESRRKKQ
ncbi:enoyl-CoA hydratase/isomerase family protein [Aeropyrum camini]|uniref:Enoyl-CoA hydratase/isomerase n=1 Tax=Aeropyrum camini SY1 = JCM 12091 TaxID=1198449 RepID=U3TC39_9CREN|nr:enoyl-CoA hydratase/isomerase family protein [Aeropyrum camini]BAN89513.1 enoyl-CoA hydratase/isomerase [Aeropyrum camini SY1 = JCM 12091]